MYRSLSILATLAALLLFAPAVQAETVVLRSGKKVRAERVEVVDDTVRATLAVSGGTAIVTYRFERLEPAALLVLLERHWLAGQDAQADGAAALRIAAVARRFALLDEAVVWLAHAAELDPALSAQRDTGLEAIRSARVGGALALLEDLLRAGRPEQLVAAADEALAGELALLLTPTEALRMDALRALAQKRIDRESAAAGQVGPVPGAPPVQPGPMPANPPEAAGLPQAGPPKAGLPKAGLPKAVLTALERVSAAEGKARAARDQATDPSVSNARARRLLETGARSLLDARRLLRELPSPLPAVALERAVAVDEALLVTWLDIAELDGEAQRLDSARRFLRAARLLDPESDRAREIELKLATTAAQRTPYDDGTLLDWLYVPGPYDYFGPRYLTTGYRTRTRRYGYGRLGFPGPRYYSLRIGGHGHHHGGSHHHGSHRVVGRRR